MKRITVLLSALVLAILFACSGGKEKKSTVDGAAVQSKNEKVRVISLETRKIAHSVEYTATLQGYEEVHLAPASPGRIEAIYVEEGSRVAKGTVLVQMDRTQLHQAEIQMKTVGLDYERLDTLQKVGSITRLKAPFSGIISGKYFEPGEMYTGAPIPTVGKAAILTLVQIDRLKLVVPVSEKYYPQIKSGMEAMVKNDTYPDRSFTGKVARVFPTIDPATRTFSVEVVLSNSGGILRPGMFARVSFDLEEVNAIVLPALAVLKMQGSNERYLFIEKEGKAKRISVTIGSRYDDLVEVVSDLLQPGDKVIVSGQSRLLDGVAVEVVSE